MRRYVLSDHEAVDGQQETSVEQGEELGADAAGRQAVGLQPAADEGPDPEATEDTEAWIEEVPTAPS